MALINPSNLYSGGQGVLDSRYTNFIIQQEAKKRAQDEAATQYFTKLPEKINTAGVREQDKIDPVTGSGILKDIADWQSMWMRDKDNIKRGGLPQQQYMSKFQDILSKIDKSKSRAKLELELGKAKFENKFSPRQKDFPILEKIGRSIYDPASYKDDGVSEYGLQDFSAAVGVMTPKDLMAFKRATFGQFKPEYDETEGSVRMGDSGKILVTKKYKPESIRSIGEQAAALTKADGKAQNYYEDLMTMPEEVEKATAALKRFVGPNELPDTPEKMAKGLMMAEALGYKVEEEEKDVEADRRFRKKMQDERLAAQLKRLRISEAGKNARVKALMGGVEVDDVLGKAKAMAKTIKPMFSDAEFTVIPLNSLDEIEKQDILGKKDNYGSYEISPYMAEGESYLIMDADGNIKGQNAVISPERVLNNTYNRTKGKLKAEYKKEIKPEPAQKKKVKINW